MEAELYLLHWFQNGVGRVETKGVLTPSPRRETGYSAYARPTPPAAQRGPLQRVSGLGVDVHDHRQRCNSEKSGNFSTLGAIIHLLKDSWAGRIRWPGFAWNHLASRPRPPKVESMARAEPRLAASMPSGRA